MQIDGECGVHESGMAFCVSDSGDRDNHRKVLEDRHWMDSLMNCREAASVTLTLVS
jgi:hypothetical protein